MPPDKVPTKTTRLWIPHPSVPDCRIAGDLESQEHVGDNGKKIALILHGTMGHKDYLFQKKLALWLPIDSFRFDFRGSHETGGTWKMGSIEEDVEDLQVVVQHLTERLGYNIELIVGHSRGSLAAFRWLCTAEAAKRVGAFVNVAGRYRMWVQRDAFYKPFFDDKGYYEWKVTVARNPVVGRIYPEDVNAFGSWDTSLVWDDFPSQVDVLTIQGLKDGTVPPYDAVIYACALGNRSPGTHNLHFVEEADHNFVGYFDEVVETILDWLRIRSQEKLRTGMWKTGVRGRL
ncbi:alpha/beta-hydrolase [Rickenella mellea]|uniref:Alpha/beta-hydrolase n=1 Tax=Rickenella mellea TaxID=50990 RepID=A0A4Y7Q5Y9_9AGAM|nr:alpha/beta-hydrolase [Rickenella mellea]